MSKEIRHILQQATIAFEAGHYEEAEPLLLQVLEQTPTYANLYNMLGVIAGQRGASEEAVALFRQALNLNPTYTEARLNLTLSLAETGSYDQAAQEMSKLQSEETATSRRLGLGIRGKLANAHAELGRKYHALGLYIEAVAEYDKALDLCPTFPDIHRRRAVSCREMAKYADAESSLRHALELKPNYVEAYVDLGMLQQRLGKLSDAVKAWERALQLDPKHRLARIYLKLATAPGTGAR
jgi:tetratricopeptide (TPR) repeat protein